MSDHATTTSIGDDTIIGRLINIARQRPESLAIIDADARVTYADLDAASLAIARAIVATSDGRRGNVCLMLTDKVAAIRAIFGAMRSGNACVPLDAADPQSRLRFILRDSEPVALLTDRVHIELAHALAPVGCAVVDVDAAPRHDIAQSLPAIDPARLAYVSYTSGSTGTPKGVTQTHANALFFIDSYATAFGIGPGDRISVLSAIGVPAGLGDILRGIVLGASLCAFDIRRTGVAQLAGWLDRQRVTVLHAVPTVFREMANRMAGARVLPHLRLVHLGGEALFSADIALFRAHTLEHCVMFNQLASTEVSVIARNTVDHRTQVPCEGVVAAGRPIDGVHVEIRREDGSVAAADEAGEMIVASAHVSPGYWRRPDLDAAAFSPDPARPGWRRYRSGDLGRIDAAGRLWFLGRAGTRVKVHGHSVDLMEIEAALAGCPGVVKSAVLAEAGDAQTDSARLVAYVEAGPDAVRDPAAVRRHLAGRVPLYMLPATVRYVASMPLTIGGKIDRMRLGEAETLPASATAAAPDDEIERGVGRVFEALLKIESVGAEDDFFLLGGDSLMGAELQVRLAEQFGVRVANFHEDATVAGIAAGIRRERSRSATRVHDMPVMLPLWQSGNEIPLFIVHGRHGQAFVSPYFMRLLGDDQPVWSFQARGLDGASTPHGSIDAMADDYLAEMRKVRPHGPYLLGSLCAGVFIVTIMARRLRESGETVLPLLLLDPPNSVFQPGYLNLTQAQFEEKMRARKAAGGSGGPVGDPSYMQALLRSVLAFERAIAMHRPLPYDGDAFMLSSTARVRGADVAYFNRMFTGKVVRYEIGATHRQAMHPHNPAFIHALVESVAQIRAAARGAPPAERTAATAG
jgi:amino acid adenylation domain-containing protein